jgi:hypothetical protein
MLGPSEVTLRLLFTLSGISERKCVEHTRLERAPGCHHQMRNQTKPKESLARVLHRRAGRQDPGRQDRSRTRTVLRRENHRHLSRRQTRSQHGHSRAQDEPEQTEGPTCKADSHNGPAFTASLFQTRAVLKLEPRAPVHQGPKQIRARSMTEQAESNDGTRVDLKGLSWTCRPWFRKARARKVPSQGTPSTK